MPEQTINIEEREIRGLNFKLLRAVIWSTITIVTFIVGAYFQLQGSINEIKTIRAGEEKYNDLRLKAIETNIQFLQKQIDGLNVMSSIYPPK